IESTLELYNPLEKSVCQVHDLQVEVTRDISAPFEYQLRHTPDHRLVAFIDPGAPEDNAGLRFVEPYQPGKIPIVFVHGLLSDPSTWFDMANDLRDQPWFHERYQIWAFRYASGEPFITSALELRTQLQDAVNTLDPEGQDPALRRMVLVGHSM